MDINMGQPWCPPEESRACRKINARMRSTYRGHIFDGSRSRAFQFESKLERDFLYIALASSSVAEVIEQPAYLEYRDAGGHRRKHVPDALVTMVSGTRIAVALKPAAMVERSQIEQILDLLAKQVGADFADRYVLRTEQHLHPDDVFDAKLILRARGLPDSAADETISELIRTQCGWSRLADLVAASAAGAAGFNAIVRQIGQGRLLVRDGKRISEHCFVRPKY